MVRLSVVAVDGPAASGKSTVARALATELGFRSLDTGLIYRVITREVLRTQTDPDDSNKVALLADSVLHRLQIEPSDDSSSTIVRIDGAEVSESELHHPELSQLVARVSPHDGVRGAVRAIQHRLVAEGSIVIAGRDIGTVVAPEAELKIFLDVSLAERASRRLWSLPRGTQVHQAQLEQELHQRDELDRARKKSPMIPAVDAVVLRTDGLSVSETVATILQLAGLKEPRGGDAGGAQDTTPHSQFTVGAYARRNDRVLLLWHDDLHRWVPPGGRLRTGSSEAPHEAAIRHCREECGLDVVPLPVQGDLYLPRDSIAAALPTPAGIQRLQLDPSSSYLDLVFYCEASPKEPVLNYRQARAYHWFSKLDLDAFPLYPHVQTHSSRSLEFDRLGAPEAADPLESLTMQAREIGQLYDALNNKRFGRVWEPRDVLLGYVTDTGDLARLLMAEDGLREKSSEHSALLDNEFADSLWSLLTLADSYGVDLWSAYRQLVSELRRELGNK